MYNADDGGFKPKKSYTEFFGFNHFVETSILTSSRSLTLQYCYSAPASQRTQQTTTGSCCNLRTYLTDGGTGYNQNNKCENKCSKTSAYDICVEIGFSQKWNACSKHFIVSIRTTLPILHAFYGDQRHQRICSGTERLSRSSVRCYRFKHMF